jgi:hypothetical protein
MLFGAQAGRTKIPTVTWEEDWEAAQAQASKTGKPLFVVFRCKR